MLTNKGTIYLVNDINLALQCSYNQGCKVIYIGELNMNLPKSFVSFGALLPPYDALNAEIESMCTSSIIYTRIFTWDGV